MLFAISKNSHITIYPRKGTKTHEPLPLNLSPNITTYPRKGTKNFDSFIWNRTELRLQLTPARGQQSTSVTGVLPAAEVLCFILILFTGYRASAMPAEMVIVTGSALTP